MKENFYLAIFVIVIMINIERVHGAIILRGKTGENFYLTYIYRLVSD